MPVTRGDVGHAAQLLDEERISIGPGVLVDADLVIAVVAPAPDRAVGAHRERVRAPRRQRHRRAGGVHQPVAVLVLGARAPLHLVGHPLAGAPAIARTLRVAGAHARVADACSAFVQTSTTRSRGAPKTRLTASLPGGITSLPLLRMDISLLWASGSGTNRIADVIRDALPQLPRDKCERSQIDGQFETTAGDRPRALRADRSPPGAPRREGWASGRGYAGAAAPPHRRAAARPRAGDAVAARQPPMRRSASSSSMGPAMIEVRRPPLQPQCRSVKAAAGGQRPRKCPKLLGATGPRSARLTGIASSRGAPEEPASLLIPRDRGAYRPVVWH